MPREAEVVAVEEDATTVIARNLGEALRASGLSQTKLAQLSGVPQSTINVLLRPETRVAADATGRLKEGVPKWKQRKSRSKVEPKQRSPTVLKVEKLAKHLGLETWQLFHTNLQTAKMLREIEKLGGMPKILELLTEREKADGKGNSRKGKRHGEG